MGEPLTTEDLYGTTPPVSEQKPPENPLKYEETPVIEPVPSVVTQPSIVSEPPKLSPPHQLPLSKKTTHPFLTFVLFVVLFIAGIWLSSSLRQFFPTSLQDSLGLSQATSTPTPTPVLTLSPTLSSDWKKYSVINGATKRAIDGVEFSLPSDVLSPICDGVACASQGTYLPGGTRFTIAPRGAGYTLRDYRGTAISDVNGTTFTTKPVTVSGRQSMQFTGTFTGRTVSGYAFATMRGVMIPITDTTSLEVNHFIPSGITADFESDDLLFESILNKIVISTGVTQKGGTPMATSTP